MDNMRAGDPNLLINIAHVARILSPLALFTLEPFEHQRLVARQKSSTQASQIRDQACACLAYCVTLMMLACTNEVELAANPEALSRASSLRSLWGSASQGAEENQLQRVSVPA